MQGQPGTDGQTAMSFRPSRQPEVAAALEPVRQPLRVRTRTSAGFMEGPSSPRDVQVHP